MYWKQLTFKLSNKRVESASIIGNMLCSVKTFHFIVVRAGILNVDDAITNWDFFALRRFQIDDLS